MPSPDLHRFLLRLLFAGASMACVASAWAQDQSWWNDSPWANPDRGFNWYPPDAPRVPKKIEPAAKPAPRAPAPPKNIREMKSVEEIRKELVRLRDVAIMTPTQANVLAYLDANNFMMDKSSTFSDTWRRVVWQNPQVDYNTRSPVASFAQTALKDKRQIDQGAVMAALAKTHGVLFFYRSDCEFCKLQAPIMQMLNQRYGIEVLAVSVDGGGIREFPNAKLDNGISLVVTQGRGVQTVPALFLVSRDQKQVLQLGSGVLAMDEIVERARVLTTTQVGEAF